MIVLKIAFRALMRRKGRMVLIGILVAFGTFLIVAGGVFSQSAGIASRNAIAGNFTGDFVVYSAKSKEIPSPFAFGTPLPPVKNAQGVADALASLDNVATWTMFAQNYGIIEVDRAGTKRDLPVIFYAVEPESWLRTFPNAKVVDGSWFGTDGSGGIMISRDQNAQYAQKYGVTLKSGERVKLLGVTEGGANAVETVIAGSFEPIRYRSVFNYINFVDAATYARLFNYAGVEELPQGFDAALGKTMDSEENIFALAHDEAVGTIDVGKLKAEPLSGFSMIAVKLKDRSKLDETMRTLTARTELDIKTARWDEASGFYAKIADALQAFIALATGLIFLVVVMIFMNTLIINVIERTGEIGTMRAIGADKSFIRATFLAESLLLNTAAAAVGMIAAVACIAIGSRGGFPLPETISQFLIGGGPLPLTVSPWPFAAAVTTVLAVSFLATLYPISVATSITPIRAMNDR
jgi:putative ABC transport system permease protein